MTLRIPAKVLLHVWSYDFYDMTLSPGKQRRQMIITVAGQRSSPDLCFTTEMIKIYIKSSDLDLKVIQVGHDGKA